MLSYQFYRSVHFIGFALIFFGAGAVMMRALLGLAKDAPHRRVPLMVHGLGMLLSLVGSFGLLARLGIAHGSMPGWAIAKLGIWLCFGALIAPAGRSAFLAKIVTCLCIILFLAASYIAQFKPF